MNFLETNPHTAAFDRSIGGQTGARKEGIEPDLLFDQSLLDSDPELARKKLVEYWGDRALGARVKIEEMMSDRIRLVRIENIALMFSYVLFNHPEEVERKDSLWEELHVLPDEINQMPQIKGEYHHYLKSIINRSLFYVAPLGDIDYLIGYSGGIPEKPQGIKPEPAIEKMSGVYRDTA